MVFTQTATPESSNGRSSAERSSTGLSSTGLSATGGPPAAADLPAAIAALKQQKKAVILAHYYQDNGIQDIADVIGDSLELARKAATTDADDHDCFSWIIFVSRCLTCE